MSGVQDISFTRHELLHISNVVERLGKWIGDVNGQNFPVGLSVVNQSQSAQHFDLNEGIVKE